MDYRPDDEHVGGMDGCMNFQDEDNKGIPSCVKRFGIDKLYHKWNHEVSLADFITIIAEAAIGRAATDQFSLTYDKNNYFREGTFAKYLRDTFKYGRKTANTCDWNTGRMPNPEHSCEGDPSKGKNNGLKQVFVENVFRDSEYPWTLTTAISGAHTVGGAHLNVSGYDGTWKSPEMSGIFDNGYYRAIMANGWRRNLSVGGNPNKNQWRKSDLSE